MNVGLIPDKKLVKITKSKAVINLPVIEYVVNALEEYYKNNIAYCNVRIIVIKFDNDHTATVIAGLLRMMNYVVDILLAPSVCTYDALFVPTGYALDDDTKTKTSKIIEY